MIARTFFLLSLLYSTLALYIRQDSISDQDLLNSCPGGPGSDKVEKADKCTFINIVNNPNTRTFVVLGDPQLNCGNATDPVNETLGGEHTVSQTNTINANLGIDIEGITIGGGAELSDTDSTTVSRSITYTIPPHRQAVYVAGTAQKSLTGNVQVNYADRQFGHFIWFTATTITQLTPIPDDVFFDVYESDCGTDPRDLSGYNH